MIYNQNVLAFSTDQRYHAMLCDPPYELAFMNKGWDNSGVAFNPATWEHLKQFLYPGAFCMAFASTRTYHRICVAIEDAGFIIHPMIVWVQGQGFPKATRIDDKIDKMLGLEQTKGDVKVYGDGHIQNNRTVRNKSGRYNFTMRDGIDPNPVEMIPNSDLAKAFKGYRYGLQALKPSLEPIIVFQKPYEGKPIDNITRYGSGVLNINDSRIESEPIKTIHGKHPVGIYGNLDYVEGSVFENSGGRWPSNFILSHSEDCTDEGCAEHCPIVRLGDQSGIAKADISVRKHGVGSKSYTGGNLGIFEQGSNNAGYIDTGTASRFFYQTDYLLEHSDPFFYAAKASTSERSRIRGYARNNINKW